MSAPSAVVLRFRTYEEEMTLARRIEAKAIDLETGLPVQSLPILSMAEWLREQGYTYRTGSTGVWQRRAS